MTSIFHAIGKGPRTRSYINVCENCKGGGGILFLYWYMHNYKYLFLRILQGDQKKNKKK